MLCKPLHLRRVAGANMHGNLCPVLSTSGIYISLVLGKTRLSEGVARVTLLTVGPNLSAPSSYRLTSSLDQLGLSPVRCCPESSPDVGVGCSSGDGRAGRGSCEAPAELGGDKPRVRTSGNSSRIFCFLPTSRSRDLAFAALSSSGEPGCGSGSFCAGTIAT